jgi:hypothetical protein
MGLHKQVLLKYHEFLLVFEEKRADARPPHHSYDHGIDPKDSKQLPWGPIYALSEVELKALREY